MRELVSHCTTIDETEPQRTAALLLSLLLVQNMWTNSVSSHLRFQIAIPPSLSPSTATAFNSDALWFWTLHAHWCGVPSLAQSCPLLPMTPALSLPTP